jgi:hypothetical protein
LRAFDCQTGAPLASAQAQAETRDSVLKRLAARGASLDS